MTVRVAVPLRIARMRVWVDKGNDWSAVDRLILWALTREPRTSIDLAETTHVPARLINSIILRLMHAGWVELAAGSSGAGFRASELGREALEYGDVLPVVPRRTSRRLTFTIEPFSLRAYSVGELRFYRPGEIKTIAKDHDVRQVVIKEDWSQLTTGQLHEAAEAILADVAGDEELSLIDFNASSFPSGFALFTVMGKAILGLPKDAPVEMVRAVQRAAASERAHGAAIEVRTSRALAKPSLASAAVAVPPIDRNDILVTGAEHQTLLEEALARARIRVVIHSTFLESSAFEKLKSSFQAAAKQGAQIDIFWGAARTPDVTKRNLDEAIIINQMIQKDLILRGRARVHMECTRSHAKLLIADSGSQARHLAAVGSCNWLSTGFSRVEASVVLRHAHAVANFAQDFADLILRTIPVSDVAGDLNRLARSLKKLPAPSGASRIAMIKGDMHGEAIRYAREKATKRIVIGGDRLGLGAEPRTLVPLAAASDSRNVEGVIYFSRTSKPLRKADVATLKREVAEANVRLVEVDEGELHGKFLLWDDDDIVISSLNWSSADTRRDSPYAEIGVHLSGPNLARDILQRLEGSFSASNLGKKRSRRRRRKR
jgi:cardiolipin synthase A/B